MSVFQKSHHNQLVGSKVFVLFFFFFFLPGASPAHAMVSFLSVLLWWQVRILVNEDFALVLDLFFNFF